MRDPNRSGNPNWTKGRSGNPAGRVKKPEIIELRKALVKVEKKKGKKFFEYFVERAFNDDTMAKALLNKLLPDMKFVEVEASGKDGEPISLIMYGKPCADDT